ncbi:MAG: ATP-grasp domain-containing protein [Gammaproteobacteria bacterium]|nr:ATP-grasp domain-containing protein [Gammaproteobacteria bacterium]
MKQSVLLVSPAQSYRLAAYLKAAEALDINLVIASEGEHSLNREVADGISIDLDDPTATAAAVARADSKAHFSAILATDDATVELASHIARNLGLASNPIASAQFSRRKDLGRQRLREAGVRVPDHWILDLSRNLHPQLDALPYPLVLKPISLSASRGVIRVDSPEEADNACKTIARIIAPLHEARERQTILAEAYIPGSEVAFEGLLLQGKLHTLAVFDKPDPLTGPFFEETYYITPSRLPQETQREISATVNRACVAYGLHRGPIHAEVRLNERGAWILEVAARTIGGECSRTLDTALAHPLEEYVLAAALDSPIPLEKLPGASGVLMIPTPSAGVLRSVTGQDHALQVSGVTGVRITVEPGHVLEMLPEASAYLGFVYGAAETAEQVESTLREAHQKIKFKIDPLWQPADTNHASSSEAILLPLEVPGGMGPSKAASE